MKSESTNTVVKMQFTGYPEYLEMVSKTIGHPEAAGPAGRLTALGDVANLCAQASLADPTTVNDIMRKAKAFRDQLHVAYLASSKMIEHLAGIQTND
jgi:hypothetical protein